MSRRYTVQCHPLQPVQAQRPWLPCHSCHTPLHSSNIKSDVCTLRSPNTICHNHHGDGDGETHRKGQQLTSNVRVHITALAAAMQYLTDSIQAYCTRSDSKWQLQYLGSLLQKAVASRRHRQCGHKQCASQLTCIFQSSHHCRQGSEM